MFSSQKTMDVMALTKCKECGKEISDNRADYSPEEAHISHIHGIV